MVTRIGRLFVLKTGFEAGLVIYALALGAALRGLEYLDQYPGPFGWSLMAACLVTVLIAGASIVDGIKAWRARQPEQRMLARVVSRAAAATPVRQSDRLTFAPERNGRRRALVPPSSKGRRAI